MPDLTDEQKEAIQAVKEAFDTPSPGGDLSAFSEALKSEAGDYFQDIFKNGLGVGKGENQKKVDAAQAEAEEARQRAADLEEEVETLREETPDVEALREKYEKRVSETESEYKERIEELESRLNDGEKDRFFGKLESELKNRVDEFTAETLVERQSVRSRVEINDGSVRILDEDGDPLPVNGDAHEYLAEQLTKSVPERFRKDTRKSGPGYGKEGDGNGNSSSFSGVRSKADLEGQDQIRAFVKERGREAYLDLPETSD